MREIVAGGATLVAALAVLLLFAAKEGIVLNHIVVAADTIEIFEGTKGVTIFAAGDMLFDRRIRQMSVLHGDDYPFSCIDSLIATADFAVANLEGPITKNPSRSVGSVVGSTDNYFFTFPTTTASLLARHNFKAVGVGNNHILNFGYQGLLSTQEYLAQAGVGYFGGVEGNEGVFETEVNGTPLAFLGYNEFGGDSVATVANRIAEEKKEGRVVLVYAHWGDEYIDSSARLRPIAELFAEQGASAVIGSHPHVVLGHEYIGTMLVYYSLGNFIFDQYWNEEVRHGLTLILHINKSGLVVADEHPTEILRDGRVCPLVQKEVI